MPSVAVLGSTGFTGRLVVEALLGMGVRDVVLGGRDAGKLRALGERLGGIEWRVADTGAPETLAALVAGVRVVVSTAGPFARHGEPVVAAAVSAGAHFLDTTGEQAYMARVLERFDEPARRAGLAVINAQAFEFALGYCAAALLLESAPDLDTVDVFNRADGFRPSRGTLKSALGALAEPALVLQGGRLVERGLSPAPMHLRLPGAEREELAVPFPGGEALHLPRAYPALRGVTTNLVLPAALARAAMLGWAARPAWRALRGWRGALERRIDAGSEGPAAELRVRQTLRVVARGGGPGGERYVVVAGADPYGITGTIAALGARLLLEGPPLRTGVVSTDQAFGARRFLEALAPWGVAIDTTHAAG